MGRVKVFASNIVKWNMFKKISSQNSKLIALSIIIFSLFAIRPVYADGFESIGSTPGLTDSAVDSIGSSPGFSDSNIESIGFTPGFSDTQVESIGSVPAVSEMSIAPVEFVPAVSSFALPLTGFPLGFSNVFIPSIHFKPGSSDISIPGIAFNPGSSNINIPPVAFNPGSSNINIPPLSFNPGSSNVNISPIAFSPGSSGIFINPVFFSPGFSGVGLAPVTTPAYGASVPLTGVPATGLADDPRVITFVIGVLALAAALSYLAIKAFRKYKVRNSDGVGQLFLPPDFANLFEAITRDWYALLSRVPFDNSHRQGIREGVSGLKLGFANDSPDFDLLKRNLDLLDSFLDSPAIQNTAQESELREVRELMLQVKFTLNGMSVSGEQELDLVPA